ncbi:hypothetical protein SAMN05216354_0377 [Xylanibacter ruminicola]|uniref:Uncharacterized protein n=1 Tax=Xylanibacter ruminicola TaxID=839 RepID=A0A1H5RX29_XYLRU|nr:hypothetical protein [Xylanibacter ruminicola]SEF42674.1 hypothetical protein SAMN05216354_0377 [Xylanibacter ruminicola]
MAEYSMVSVPKQGANPGMPEGKKNVLILFDFDQVKTYTRDEKGVTVTAFELNTDVTPIGMFVNEATIDAGDEADGDSYARGFLHHVNADHPGTELAVAEFKANNINANLGAIILPCDPGATSAKIYGTPCAPLKMQAANEQDTNEAHNNHFELKTEQRTYPVGIMAKSLIPVTDNAQINAYLGLPVSAGV